MVVVTLRKVDVYEVAYLAGGPPRCLETAVVSLLEKGWLRASRDGGLTVVETVSEHPVEAAVLAGVPGAASGWCTVDDVRAAAWRSGALVMIAEKLMREGNLRRAHQVWPLRWSGRACCTSQGQALLRDQRVALQAEADLTSSVLAVALDGPGSFADDELRAAVFGTSRRRPGRGFGDDSSSWTLWSGWSSADGGGQSGHGGHGCGGAGGCGGGSCGGGCGGGGCGGG